MKNNLIIIGVDEAGRGPLAGPVVAGAVYYARQQNFFCAESLSTGHLCARKNLLPRIILSKIKDSKQISEKQREIIFEEITKCPYFAWGVGVVSEKIIDKINILEATKLATQKAVKNLILKLKKDVAYFYDRELERQVLFDKFFVLIDGNMKFEKNWFGKNIEYKSIIKGDQKVFSISTASIIAKVYRDRLMKKYAKKYPQYGFEINKGYGTKKHFAILEKFGPCKIHRRSFCPVNKYNI